MRKLRPAEEKYIGAFSDGFKSGSLEIPGVIHDCSDWPKGVNVKTVENLYKMGLIEHSFISFYSCPMRLTEKGKEIKRKLK